MSGKDHAKVAVFEVHGSKNQLNKGVGWLYGVMCHCGQGSKPCLQCDCPTRLSNPLVNSLGQDKASSVEEVIV